MTRWIFRRRRVPSAALLALGLSAAIPTRLPAQLALGLPPTQDDQWRDVARRVPGFAGFWLEGSTLVLALVDTTRRTAALRELAGQFSVDRYRNVRVQPVTYDFAQLYAWKQLVAQHLGSSGGAANLTAVDADEVHNGIHVWVADSSDLAPARHLLVELGVPSTALSLEVGTFVPD